MRSSSGGKFSLGSAFGRRGDKHDRQPSYSGSTTNDFGAASTGDAAPERSRINGAAYNDQPDSPNARSGGEGGGSGGGGVQLKKLGKTFAHNNLLPGLGNKDLKALQDVIAAEKGVLSNIEKLAIETQKAASVLPNYGLQEGPDLQDILTQSSYLLNHFSSALNVYAERQVSLRGSYKKIRDREEALLELRSQRRSTGSKAETAERKLAKMGPENKGLVSQTELLERLRQEMRSMDSEIVKEETGLGDFKRQIVKEAFMYKFSGLEELGEKLCIIGEMGKLVIDEIPLEETPVGYGRAPYGGFTKTESAVEEAGRCLGQVKFTTVETALKPSHLPHAQHLPGRSSVLHRQESIAAAEEFAHLPAGMSSPQTPGRQGSGYGTSVPPPGPYGLDENPYGGIDNRATNSHNAYGEYGGVRPGDVEGDARRERLWQGPTEDALRQQNRASDGIEYAQARIASMYGAPGASGSNGGGRNPSLALGSAIPTPPGPHAITEEGPDYEHQQQAEMDRQQEQEQAAWREHSNADRTPLAGQHDAPLPNPYEADLATQDHAGSSALSPPWQPLNVKRDKSVTPEPRALHDGPVPTPHVNEPSSDPAAAAYTQSDYHSEAHSTALSELAPPPSMAQLHARAPTPGTEGFRTPAESPNLDAASFQHSAPTIPPSTNFSVPPPVVTAIPASPPLPAPSAGFAAPARPASPSMMSPGGGASGGKMSAGAFRKAAPRRSETTTSVVGDEEGSGSDAGRGPRRLPVPPGGGYTPGIVSPGLNAPGAWPDEKRALIGQRQEAGTSTLEDERGAPPSYGQAAPGQLQHDESLR